ncbi:hypothetical protein, partial [Streptococcus sp. 10824]|uniref:hypothetical protein n=1 Tax=Streptococcus sp. 10824 TaxID=2582678 RepID=UPI0019657B47
SPLFKTVIVIHRTDRKSFKLIDPIGLLLKIFSLLPRLLLDVYQVILFENQIQTTSTSPCRTQVQPAASFLVCSLIFIEYKIHCNKKAAFSQ